ncbi:hypothetical protein ACFW9F_16800, partial [Streptomyces sp. NPDC059506]
VPAAHSPPGGHVGSCGHPPPRPAAPRPRPPPPPDRGGWQILPAPAELAFPLHTRAAATWFADGYSGSGAPHTRTG